MKLGCAYLIILYILTCRHTIIEYVVPKHGLRRKQNCIYIYEAKKPYRGNFLKDILWPASNYEMCEKIVNPLPEREV